jgi:hypothetical protein
MRVRRANMPAGHLAAHKVIQLLGRIVTAVNRVAQVVAMHLAMANEATLPTMILIVNMQVRITADEQLIEAVRDNPGAVKVDS